MHLSNLTIALMATMTSLASGQSVTLTPYPSTGCSGTAGAATTHDAADAQFCIDSSGIQAFGVSGDSAAFPVGMAGCDDGDCASCSIDDACVSISNNGCLNLAHPDGEYKDSQSVQTGDSTECDPGYLKLKRARGT